jgi:hypothetical protein
VRFTDVQITNLREEHGQSEVLPSTFQRIKVNFQSTRLIQGGIHSGHLLCYPFFVRVISSGFGSVAKRSCWFVQRELRASFCRALNGGCEARFEQTFTACLSLDLLSELYYEQVRRGTLPSRFAVRQ